MKSLKKYHQQRREAGGGSAWAGVAQAASGIAGGLISNAGNARRQRKAYHQQKKLMDIQQKNQMALNRQGADLQYEQWQKTNYPAQMEMLKEAGLNPSMLYGMTGGGGATAGSQGGGQAASGSAPSPIPMDINSAINSAMAASVIELQKANAEKARAEASSIKGEEGTTGAAEIANKEAQTRITNLGYEIGRATQEDQIEKVHWEVENLVKQNALTEEQTNLAKEQIAAIGVKMQLDKANINLSQAQVDKIVNDIRLGWQGLDATLQKLQIDNQGNKLRALEGKTRLSQIQADFALGVLGKDIDLMKLNIEQQRIFTSIFQSLFIGGAVAKQLEPARKEVKGFKRE